jgi:hypothetical protein
MDGLDDMNFFHKYVPFFLGHNEAQYRLAAVDFLLLKSLKDESTIEITCVKQLLSIFDEYWNLLPKPLPRSSTFWSPKGQEPLSVIKKIGSIFRNTSFVEENGEKLLAGDKMVNVILKLSSLLEFDADFETIAFDLFTNLSPLINLEKEDKTQLMLFFTKCLYHRELNLSSMAADVLLLLCQQPSNCSYLVDQSPESLSSLFQQVESLLFRGSSDLIFTSINVMHSLLSLCSKDQKVAIASKTRIIKSLATCLGSLSRDSNNELLEKILFTLGLFLTEPSLTIYYHVYEPIFFQFFHDRTDLNLPNDRPLFLMTELITEASFSYHSNNDEFSQNIVQ